MDSIRRRTWDTWGPYSSSRPANRVGELIVKNILDYAPRGSIACRILRHGRV